MYRNHNLGRLFAWMLAAMFIFGCKPPGGDSGDPHGSNDSIPVRGDWVRIYQSADPDNLHPYDARSAFATFIKENIFMYLYDYDPQTLRPEPTLAKAMAEVSPDGLSYTYEMRPEAKWDDGSDITGHDFAFSMKAMNCGLTQNAHQRGYYEFVESVEVDPSNPKRFTVRTKRPFFLSENAIAGVEVVSEKFYDPDKALRGVTILELQDPGSKAYTDSAVVRWARVFNDDDHLRNPAMISGSGPYKVESWVAGDNVTLVRKADWWGDQLAGKGPYFHAFPEKLIFKTVTDRTTLPSAAQNGELDVIRDMAPDDFIAARDDTSGYIYKNYNMFTPSTYGVIYLGLNCKPSGKRKPVLEDPLVRRAFNHLVDVKSIIDNVYNGLGKEQIGPISPSHPEEYNPALKGYEFNPDKAKALLDEAGWTDSDGDGVREKMIKGRKVKLEIEALISNTGDTGPRMLAIIADQTKQAGMVINVNRLSFGEVSKRIGEHDFDMFGMGFSSGPLPTDLWQVWHTESWVNNGSNYFGFGTPETDSLIAQIRLTMDADARKQLYYKFQDLWMQQVPMVPIYSPNERIWIHKRFAKAEATVLRPGYKAAGLWAPKDQQKFK